MASGSQRPLESNLLTANMPPSKGKYYCKICKVNCQSFDAFHEHKARSSKHKTCIICSLDFNTLEGLNRHCKQDHAHAQNLPCSFCGQVFTTLGGLTGHIELGECQSSLKFDANVREKTERQNAMTAARQHFGSRSGSASPFEPLPALRDHSKSSATQNETRVTDNNLPAWRASPQWSTTEGTHKIEKEVAKAITKDDDEDLMTFDEILNSDWNAGSASSTMKQKHVVKQEKEFPALSSYKNPTPGPNLMDAPVLVMNAWSNKPTLKATPSIDRVPRQVPSTTKAQPVELALEAMMISDPPKSPFDPDNPAFKASQYYLAALGKHRCPHPGCKATATSKHAFIQHLKSSAHRNEKLVCHGCLRYFDSATSLAQHASSQGVRCKVRETDEYEKEVDRFTAGYATTAGRFDDDTIRYTVTGMPQTAQGLIDSHKAKMAEKDKEQQEFWSKHRPAW